MKKMNLLKSVKTICIALGLLTSLIVNAEVPAFDSDKPTASFVASYTQDFTTNTWDGTVYNTQWNTLLTTCFTATDIASGYLQFVWPGKRMMYSKADYTTPYILETRIEYTAATGITINRGGVVIRGNGTTATLADYMQDVTTGYSVFNREGIAFYPTLDGSSMIVQFSGTEAGAAATPITKITVPKPIGVTSFLNGTLRIEDFGTSIYVYYDGIPFVRINLSGLSGSNYASGEVLDANMLSKGTFTGMEVAVSGRVAIANRDAAIRLYSATVKTQPWDNRPATTFATSYTQDFTTNVWDGTKFYGQWDALDATNFKSTDIASGYLQFAWTAKRMIYSKTNYTAPYVIEADIDHGVTTGYNRGGVVIRAKVTSIINAEYLQDFTLTGTNTTTNFNREGIAFYPTSDGNSMIVQFSGVENGNNTVRTQILVPKPADVTSMLNRGTLRVEDYGTSIYAFYNGVPYIRIELGGLSSGVYTSGTVYNSTMGVVGTFTGMEVETTGRVAIAQRNAAMKLYNATVKFPTTVTGVTDLTSEFKAYQLGSSIILNLDGLTGQQFVSIYNMQGKRLINRQALGGEKLTIEKALKSGVYIVKVQGAEQSFKTKLIVR